MDLVHGQRDLGKEPQDWWQKMGQGIVEPCQLGTSTRENTSPALAEETVEGCSAGALVYDLKGSHSSRHTPELNMYLCI